MCVWAYADGFNLYYANRGSGCEWLDLKALAEGAMPAGTAVSKLEYYTARVSGAADPGQPRRQHIHLEALRTIPELEIFFGRFLAKAMWRPLLNLPVGDRVIRHGGARTTLGPGSHEVEAHASIERGRMEKMPVGGHGKGNKNRTPGRDAIKTRVRAMEEKGSDGWDRRIALGVGYEDAESGSALWHNSAILSFRGTTRTHSVLPPGDTQGLPATTIQQRPHRNARARRIEKGKRIKNKGL